jgi:hypothetical protein
MRLRPFNPSNGFRPDNGTASTGLIGRYLFEGGSVLDSSGRQNTGTLSQVASHNLSFGNGPMGPRIILPNYTSAAGSGIVLPAAANTSTFTYAAWINPASLSGVGSVVASSAFGGPQFYIASGLLTFTAQNAALIGQSSGAPVTVGVWQHVAVSYDGTNWALYYNGVRIASGANSQSFSFASQVIGSAFNSVNFDGSMSDVQIYNRVVSPAEMAAIYGYAVAPVQTGEFDFPVIAIIASDVNASASQTLDNVTQSAAATVPDGATGTETLGNVTQSAAATLIVTASGSQTLGNVTQSGAAAVIVSASGSQSLDSVTQSGAATIPASAINASGSQTLDSVSQSAAAIVPVNASGAATLGNVTQSGSATVPDGAQGTEPLDNVVQLATASITNNASGSVTLDGVSQSAATTVIIGAVGVQTLGDVVQTGKADFFIAQRVYELFGTISRSLNISGGITRDLWVSGTIPRKENRG